MSVLWNKRKPLEYKGEKDRNTGMMGVGGNERGKVKYV